MDPVSDDAQSVRIPLHRRDGSIAAHTIVDADDYPMVSQWTVCLNTNGYAVRVVQTPGQTLSLSLHRELLGLSTGDGRQVDHINRDKWKAVHRLNGRYFHIGVFATEDEAAAAARRWRVEHMPHAHD